MAQQSAVQLLANTFNAFLVLATISQSHELRTSLVVARYKLSLGSRRIEVSTEGAYS